MWDQDEAKAELSLTQRIDEELTQSGAVMSTTTWDFDATGRALSRVELLWNGERKVDLRWQRFYDPRGFLIGTEATDGNGQFLGQERWSYRPDGLKGEWEQYDKARELAASNLFMYEHVLVLNLGEQAKRPIVKNITATDERSGRTVFKDFEYDERGHLLKTVLSDAGRSFTHSFERDDEGKLLQMWHARDGALAFGERYHYEGALLVRVEELEPDTTLSAVRSLRYDDQGRVIEELKHSANGKFLLSGKRSRYVSR